MKIEGIHYKFRKGDKLRIKSIDKRWYGMGYEHLIGMTGYVKGFDYDREEGYTYYTLGGDDALNEFFFIESELEKVFEDKKPMNNNGPELIQDLKLSDLKDRWIVKVRCGEEYVVSGDDFLEIKDGKYTGESLERRFFKEDMTRDDKANYYDIMKVYKPRYDTIYKRKRVVKTMSMKKVREELMKIYGCEIKIKN